jgi:hypothetical protein
MNAGSLKNSIIGYFTFLSWPVGIYHFFINPRVKSLSQVSLKEDPADIPQDRVRRNPYGKEVNISDLAKEEMETSDSVESEPCLKIDYPYDCF